MAELRGWTATWTPRARLTSAATIVLALCLSGASVVLVWQVHHNLVANLDQAAAREARALAAQAGGSAKQLRIPVTGLNEVSQVVDASGGVVASSANVDGEPPVFNVEPVDAGRPTVRTARVSAIDDAEYRVAAVLTDGSPQYRVFVGLPLGEAQGSTEALATALAIGVPALLAALALLTWFFSGVALRPSDQLLERLDAALRRQRQFVADAAHELRSPVAAIRTQLEVDDSIQHGSVVSSLTQESVRLSHLVDDLLALARIDAEPHLRRETIDLDHLVFEEAQLLRARTDRVVDTRSITACQVLADPELIARVIRNLLDNASRHATSTVSITTAPEGQLARLIVADDGPGIPPAERKRVLQRFARLDEARTRDAGGVGLGLAIVNDVVRLHGGELSITDNKPGARITITLPLK